MKDTVRLGRVAGIPVGVNWSIIVVALGVVGLLAFRILPPLYPDASVAYRLLASTAGTLLFFVSILGHELGHALVARRHDVGVAGITLWLLGGVAKLMRQAPTPRAEFQIAIAGPLVSLLLGLGFGSGAIAVNRTTDSTLPPVVLAWLAAVNLLLAISNLLPGAPLDGGRVLTAILWKRTGHAELARLISARCGFVLGLLFIAGGTIQAMRFDQPSGWWTAMIGLFVLSAARSEIFGAAIRHRLVTTSSGQLMAHRPAPLSDQSTVDMLFRATGTGHEGVAVPVVRWDHEPVGYICDSMTRSVEVPARSWTTVGDLMVSADEVPRAWATETVQAVLDRIGLDAETNGEDNPQLVVIHDPKAGQPIGTLSRSQIDRLFQPPDFWGRDRPQPSEAAPDLVLPGGHRR